MTPPLPLEEAQARLLDRVDPLDTEIIPTGDAIGRWLAAPVIAGRTQPWADLSAMDGFATAGTGPWRIVGESAAGHPYPDTIHAGQAVRISTGAALPAGADAVVIVEEALVADQELRAEAAAASTSPIRRRGFDFSLGDPLLDAGTQLGAAQIALILAGGSDTVEVGRFPRVAIIDTGDELMRGPDDHRPDALPATNGPMLAVLVGQLAASIDRVGPVADEEEALARAFASVAQADVIVTSGGASVGEHDLIRPALENWGAQVDFWRVAIRPGKPLLVGKRGSQWIVGLPGNPASAYVTAFMFVLPLLRRLAGAPSSDALPKAEPAIIGRSLPTGGQRREFIRGVLESGRVDPIDERDSSALHALARANCLIDRPVHASEAAAGDRVQIYRLPGA